MRVLVGGEWAKTLNLSDTQVGCNLPFSVPVPQFPPSSWPIIQTEREVRVCRFDHKDQTAETRQVQTTMQEDDYSQHTLLPMSLKHFASLCECILSTALWNPLHFRWQTQVSHERVMMCILLWEEHRTALSHGLLMWAWKPPRSRVLSNANKGSGRSRGLWKLKAGAKPNNVDQV